ncbi:MAG: M28 family peptidase [Flavobacteriales bacterium]|nr:M28 family peptidase [Flavobacteriales bacterium]
MERLGSLKARILGLIIIVCLIACGGEEKSPSKNQNKRKVERKKVERPNFSSDSTYAFIQKQVDFGPRVPNTKAHVEAGNYLAAKLKSYQLEVIEQEAQVVAFDNTKLNIKNIIGIYKPELNNRVLLFAHWDSRPFADNDDERQREPIMAANDGGSGVAILLEIARQTQIVKPNIGVDIIFFDAEDYVDNSGSIEDYCLGSQYWAKNLHKEGYTANFGILLDMVGAKNALFGKEFNSMKYASAYVNLVWNIAADLGHQQHFDPRPTRHVGIDDHVYVNEIANIPSIDIIQYDPATRSFAPHWHTHDDNMDVIDKATLQAVGETVWAAVLEEGK